ncbi:plasminogen activator sPA-like protein [Leptotrombidium deliense]|uniref:Plasminogen activator sPA-like protein n=1 Tax=Leptotrombidium deliense TaxID=299467 RepID=A0A443S916_9ACAR|nr:plasminogen activator sPA-like protein [Leptotrombidium deliense]
MEIKLIAVVVICFVNTVTGEQQYEKTIDIGSLVKWGSSFIINSGKNVTTKPQQSGFANVKSCGLRFSRFQEKIVGGREANRGELPWQVSLQLRRGSGWFHFCGASIINNNYILTAAHCVPDLKPSEFRIVLGAHNLKASTGYEVIATASKIIAHERYDSRRMSNDIALIRLSKPLDLSGKSGAPINAICLPEKKEVTLAEGESLLVSGWGRLSEGGAAADKLQVVGVGYISNNNCNRYYPNKIYDGMLCAGFENGGKDACQGDSGGPIVKCKSGQSCVLLGIVSWGYGCARPSNPGVYTATASYLTWVSEKISKSRE